MRISICEPIHRVRKAGKARGLVMCVNALERNTSMTLHDAVAPIRAGWSGPSAVLSVFLASGIGQLALSEMFGL